MLTLIKGAGDIASGIALRLKRAGLEVIMTDIPKPTSIRRTVCFSEAIVLGKTKVEDVTAVSVQSPQETLELLRTGVIPVLADERAQCIDALHPQVVVDAILAKKNLGTKITDAPVVIAVGPGFTAGEDCRAVVETMRGHWLGRVILHGSAIPNTGVPGNIGGYTTERVLRAPCAGIFNPVHDIGDLVKAGEVAAWVGNTPMMCTIDGTLRGILPKGTEVFEGMKSGDIDPRCEKEHCYFASDKALSVGGGVLEAILMLSGVMEGK